VVTINYVHRREERKGKKEKRVEGEKIVSQHKATGDTY